MGFEVVPVLPEGKAAEHGLESAGAGRATRTAKQRVPRFARQTARTLILARQLHNWEKMAGRTIDAVFFACIYDWDFDYAWFTSRFLPYPWAGLYLQARGIHSPNAPMPGGGRVPSVASLFSARRCLGVALLDETAMPAMRAGLPSEKKVVWFPDMANSELPQSGSSAAAIADDLVRRADGRPIVSLLGALQRSKGIELFSALVADPRMADVCFFLGGEVSWEGIPAATQAQIEDAWEAAGNLIRHPHFIPDGPAYNAIIRASTVVFAAYPSFPHSSNTLTKAACLRVPIVCSASGLMGEAVDRYALGGTIPEGDLDEAVRVIRQMLTPAWRADYERSTRAAAYAEKHSPTALKAAFAELLG
jgi:glycosyltransferase involved in cell wall biosynthesis